MNNNNEWIGFVVISLIIIAIIAIIAIMIRSYLLFLTDTVLENCRTCFSIFNVQLSSFSQLNEYFSFVDGNVKQRNRQNAVSGTTKRVFTLSIDQFVLLVSIGDCLI